MDVRAQLERCRAEYWDDVARLIDETIAALTPAGSPLLEMWAYHRETGGKRLRAMIPLLAAEALAYDPARVLPFAAACEVLHNATLVHDDLQDGDVVRRGRETVWKRWSPAQAINLGDALFQWALALVGRLDLPAEARAAMADLAVRATVRVIDGQAREFRLKDDPSPTVATYFAVAEGKTAGLFELPVVGTAKLAAAPADLIGALGEAARDLGVLFQVQDDLLDLYGDKGRDRRGSDVAEGKISILAARASENAPAEDVRRLRAILAKPREATTAEDVEEAEGIFRRSGAVDFAVAEIGRRERAIAGHPGLARAPRLRALLAGLGDAFLEPIRPVVREFGRR